MHAVSIVDLVDDENASISPARTIRDRSNNPLENFNDEEFRLRYRLQKNVVITLLHLIESDLEYPTARNDYVPPILQFLTTLRFYATENFQRTDKDLIGIHQSTAGRIIHRVTRSIATRKRYFISFPSGQDLNDIKHGFYRVAGFPNVVGVIDGTHVPIASPCRDNAELFRNRKGFFSINVQAVCDANLCFTNIVCRWPGSTHDCRMFDNSSLCYNFEHNEIDGLLLGDSGYACRFYMMTPLLNPFTAKQVRYNYAHSKTRNKIERMFGVWKQRFRCLRIPIRTKLHNTLPIVVATACLHNHAIRRNDLQSFEDTDLQLSNDSPDTGNTGTNVAGEAVRRQIVNDYF